MKKSTVLLPLFLLSITILTVACAPLAANQTQDTFENDYYSFEIPDGDWISAPAGDMVSLILNNDDYLVNIVVETDETLLSLPELVNDNREDMITSNILINTTITHEAAAIVGIETAHQLEFNYHLINPVEATNYLIVKNGRYYSITYQTEEGYFDDHLIEFETLLDSFEIK
tara:strand:+ start:5543 stop:6058 length:516 start_codon:yes stop_codon:yes gene_type:complete